METGKRDHASLSLHFLSQETDILFALGHPYPLTSALTFPLLFVFPSHLDATQILLCSPPPPPHHSQSPIKAKSLPLLFRHPETNSNISTGTCKGNCPCGKMSKSPIVVPLLPRPRDTTALSVGHIYLNVQIFPLLYCVTSLDKQQTVEKCLSTQER